jgi:hypothetical protein
MKDIKEKMKTLKEDIRADIKMFREEFKRDMKDVIDEDSSESFKTVKSSEGNTIHVQTLLKQMRMQK